MTADEEPGTALDLTDRAATGGRAPATYCAARTRDGAKHATCHRGAGWGTDHPGRGKCKLHGGCTPIRSGRFSTMHTERLRELIEKHEADPDPLNILPELAACRALFEDYINRYQANTDALTAWHESFGGDAVNPKPRQVLDVADAYKIISEITKIVERIERVRAANAISRADLTRVIDQMGRGVTQYVEDPVILASIRAAWRAIVV